MKPTPVKQAPASGAATEGCLNRMVRLAVVNHTPEELALGFIRYETARRLNPRTFGIMWRLNLSGRDFDRLIDEAASKTNNQMRQAHE